MAAANAAKEIAQSGVNVSISLTYGHSEKEETRTHTSSDAIGSTVAAGSNLNIIATGAGKDSNIRVVGSDLAAGNNVTLAADNRIDLLSAQDLEEQHSKSKSMNASAGIAASVGTNGMAFGVTGSVGLGRGQEDGSGITQRNTHVNAGNVLTMASGGDTTLKGATAAGRQVIADIGGDLNIESLQDTATFASKNESLSVSATVGFGASVSASYNKSKINSDYASVQEQSGIAAGDGGFDIRVKGNTDLKGGVIASTQAAIEENRNSLVTGTLTQSDLHNHATYKGSGFGISGGFSVGGGDGKDPKANGESKGPGGSNLMNVASSSGTRMNMPAAMFDSGSDSSVTKSGISAGSIIITDEAGQQQKTGRTAEETVAAINRNVATGMDTSGRIANNFDKESVEAGMKVSQAFLQQAAPLAAYVVGDIGKSRQDAAQREADVYRREAETARQNGNSQAADDYAARANQAQATADAWGDNGIYRVALHTATQAVIGGAAGGGSGALNGAAGVIGGNLGQQLGKELGEAEADRQGLTGKAKDDLVNGYQQAFATVGGALAGLTTGNGLASAVQGGSTAYSVDAFNRQLHQTEKDRIKQLAGNDPQKEARLTAAACAMVRCYAEYPVDSVAYQQLKQLAEIGSSDALAGDRFVLSSQTGMFRYGETGLFSDANIDALKQWNNTYQAGTRVIGAGQAVLGGLGVAGSVVTAPVSCATGIGCVANAVVGTVSADAAYAGAKQLVSGNPEYTFLNQGLQSLGMSPEAAGWVEAALGIGSAAVAGRLVNQVVGQSANVGSGANGRVGALAGNGEGLFSNVSRVPYTPANSTLGQAFDFSCAAASCRMAANLVDTPEAYVRQAILTDTSGTALSNIPSGLQQLGFSGTAKYSTTVTTESITAATNRGASVIVNVTTETGGIHAIVVDSVKGGMAYIRDPWPLGTGSSYAVPVNSLGSVLTGKGVVVHP